MPMLTSPPAPPKKGNNAIIGNKLNETSVFIKYWQLCIGNILSDTLIISARTKQKQIIDNIDGIFRYNTVKKDEYLLIEENII